MWLRARIALGFLLAFAALSNADTQATTHVAYDQSTPQAACASLLQAIHRKDLNGVGNLILECVDLDASDRQRDADGVWLGTSLAWQSTQRFGKEAARRAASYAELMVVPELAEADLRFRFPPTNRGLNR